MALVQSEKLRRTKKNKILRLAHMFLINEISNYFIHYMNYFKIFIFLSLTQL